jgi:hypothetical protein
MNRKAKTFVQLSTAFFLMVIVATADAGDRIIFEGESWHVGRIQHFDPSTGVVVIGDLSYRLSTGAVADADEGEVAAFLEPGREVVFREVSAGGSLGVGLIEEIREMAH